MEIKISSHGYTAIINPQKGANCTSLRYEKLGGVILREPRGERTDNPFLYGMPILFPANRISGGEFEFDGRQYKFPVNEPATGCSLHGSLHDREFSATEVREDFVKCKFSSEYLDFPHEFEIEISYKVSEAGLEQRTKITNFSKDTMPNLLGFHTSFNVPFIKGGKAENIRLFCECGNEIERNALYLPTGRILAEGDFERKINSANLAPLEEKFSKHCPAKGRGRIEMRDLENGVKLVYENDPKFNYRLFYNGNADEFVCLEPMNCAVDAINAPYGNSALPQLWRGIPPNSSEEYVSRIYLKNIEKEDSK